MFVGMCMSACGVSPRLRVKGFFQATDLSAKLLDHFGNNMILQDPDALMQNLHRQMPIAQMPRYAEQDLVGGLDFQKRFGLGTNTHDAAIFQFKTVAITKMHSLRKVEQDFSSPFSHQNKTATAAIIVV